jgi:predicted acylesterase/phospholipase RssA
MSENNQENKEDIAIKTLLDLSLKNINQEDIYRKEENIYKYNSLCISGGSIKGFLMLGCLQYLFEKCIIKKIENYAGTSVGAILSYLLCIGYEPIEILSFILNNKITEKLKTVNIISLLNRDGLVDFDIINENLEKMTILKCGKLLNMIDIKNKYNKNIHIITYNVTLKKEEIISHETHPNLPCLVALRMSSNVPFLFKDFKYENNYYIDGAYSNNFPIELFNNPICNTLGITIDYNIDFDFENKDNNIINYLSYLILLEKYKIQKDKIIDLKEVKKIKIFTITSKIQSFNFDIDISKKLDLFTEGYKGIKDFLTK